MKGTICIHEKKASFIYCKCKKSGGFGDGSIKNSGNVMENVFDKTVKIMILISYIKLSEDSDNFLF
jgi:hypothetical protein